jgi:hypothetical protein
MGNSLFFYIYEINFLLQIAEKNSILEKWQIIERCKLILV